MVPPAYPPSPLASHHSRRSACLRSPQIDRPNLIGHGTEAVDGGHELNDILLCPGYFASILLPAFRRSDSWYPSEGCRSGFARHEACRAWAMVRSSHVVTRPRHVPRRAPSADPSVFEPAGLDQISAAAEGGLAGHARILSIIGRVMRKAPRSVRRKRLASSSGSSPTTSPSGICTPRSMTTFFSRAERPTST
jgi:hypothetical protein